VTDRGTDRQTGGRTGVSKERAIAYMLSRAKNHYRPILQMFIIFECLLLKALTVVSGVWQSSLNIPTYITRQKSWENTTKSEYVVTVTSLTTTEKQCLSCVSVTFLAYIFFFHTCLSSDVDRFLLNFSLGCAKFLSVPKFSKGGGWKPLKFLSSCGGIPKCNQL